MATLSPASFPRLAPRPNPTFNPTLTRGGLQYMSKHFAHPESFPLMLSLAMGTAGCYLGLEAMSKRAAPVAQETQSWSIKDYRLGLTEKSVDEVLFSINM